MNFQIWKYVLFHWFDQTAVRSHSTQSGVNTGPLNNPRRTITRTSVSSLKWITKGTGWSICILINSEIKVHFIKAQTNKTLRSQLWPLKDSFFLKFLKIFQHLYQIYQSAHPALAKVPHSWRRKSMRQQQHDVKYSNHVSFFSSTEILTFPPLLKMKHTGWVV